MVLSVLSDYKPNGARDVVRAIKIEYIKRKLLCECLDVLAFSLIAIVTVLLIGMFLGAKF